MDFDGIKRKIKLSCCPSDLSIDFLNKYAGKCVCFPDRSSQVVISADASVVRAHRLATENGCLRPYIFYVPLPGEKILPPIIGIDAYGENEEEPQCLSLLSSEDYERYAGQHVCVPCFGSRRVVASGGDPASVRQTAKDSGYDDPVIFYVPRPEEHFVFRS